MARDLMGLIALQKYSSSSRRGGLFSLWGRIHVSSYKYDSTAMGDFVQTRCTEKVKVWKKRQGDGDGRKVEGKRRGAKRLGEELSYNTSRSEVGRNLLLDSELQRCATKGSIA